MLELIKKYYILFIVFFILILFSMSRVTYCPYGDLVVYFNDLLKLKSNYFASNLSAILHARETHVPLATEGGWVFFLWICSLINTNFPYFLAALLFPITIILMLLSLIVNTNKNKFALSGALIFLILVNISTQLQYNLWMLTSPYRDISSYFFSFLMLFYASCVLNNSTNKNNNKLIFLTGLFGGLATWFRIPNIILVIPVSFCFLVYFIKSNSFKYNLKASAIFICAILIGLSPLITQNFFEGKNITQFGQADLLVNHPSALPQHIHLNPSKEEIFALSENNVVCGLHLQNFKFTFPKTVKILVSRFYGKKTVVLYLVFILIGIIKYTKGSLLFLSSSLSMLTFYSFYDKFVHRYSVLHSLLFMIAVAIGVIAFLDFISKKFKFMAKPLFLNLSNGALLIVFIFVILNSFGSYKSIYSQKNLMHQYLGIVSQYVDKEDIIYNASFRHWSLQITENIYNWCWSGTSSVTNDLESSKQHSDLIHHKLTKGNNVFVFQPTTNGNFCENWKMNDIMLSYDINFVTNVIALDRSNMSLFQIKPRESQSWTKTTHIQGTNTVMWCEDTNKKYFPCNIFLQTDTIKTNITIYSGFNVFTGLSLSTNKSTNLTIKGHNQPLPGIIMVNTFNKKIEFDLRDYTIAPIFNRTFDNSYVNWKGYHLWRRDLMFLKNISGEDELFTSVLINQTCNIPVTVEYNNNKPFISLYVSCNNMNNSQPELLNSYFSFSINNINVQPKIQVAKHRKSKTYYNLSFYIPDEIKSSQNRLILSISPLKTKSLLIYKLTFTYP